MELAHIQNHLHIASEAAVKAGAFLKESVLLSKKVNFYDDKDVKLQIDEDSEKIIRKQLSITGLPIIGEENGGHPELLQLNSHYWVVDPLDGTYNYFRQQPLCCVCIGLMQGMKPVAGVIYDFNADHLFTGIVGQGLSLNNKSYRPLWEQDLSKVCLMTGITSRLDMTDLRLTRLHKLLSAHKKIRMIGSSALALMYVAAGWADIYYEEAKFLWDFAAGVALVQAAGGSISMIPSGPEHPLVFNVSAASCEDWLIK